MTVLLVLEYVKFYYFYLGRVTLTVACSVTFGFGGGGKSTSLNVISVFVALAVRLWISRVDFCMLKLSVLVTVVELYKEMIIELVFSTILERNPRVSPAYSEMSVMILCWLTFSSSWGLPLTTRRA